MQEWNIFYVHVGAKQIHSCLYFIRENFNKINLSLLDCISNDNVLIMPTNPKYKLFPRIKGLQKKVKELCPLLIKQRNVNGVKVYKQEISEKLLIQFAIIPFAFSYMDINMIPYKSDHFYFINHHFMVLFLAFMILL